ncbi:MAG: adenylyltransferase/cytidyltransferase family protein [Planctomycetota bacterium]|jgi:cytidyltransferase-like protein|nr:adenylyltransferase/cytidyltransferase family protein [Planctomycetota bacterium]
MTKVFVSGCFDMLHSGHVAFIEEAAKLGDLYIGIGSDSTIAQLKGRPPVNSEAERLYMVKALKAVKDAWINSGGGVMDFEKDVREFKPDVFMVNNEGSTPEKEALCGEIGARYVVGARLPESGLPARSTTSYREECRIPYRIDLAGGWLDQRDFSAVAPGPVLTVSVEPDLEFIDLAGMATSTRKKAIELWSTRLPAGDPFKTAKTLFCYENPPGKTVISGSQDSLGIALPGLNRLDYDGEYWPKEIVPCHDEETLAWIERHLHLLFVKQRAPGYNPYAGSDITQPKAKALADAAALCWRGATARDLDDFASGFRASFDAQIAMLPSMLAPEVEQMIEKQRGHCLAWKMVGAGGGGYMAFVTPEPSGEMIPIRIRRGTL